MLLWQRIFWNHPYLGSKMDLLSRLFIFSPMKENKTFTSVFTRNVTWFDSGFILVIWTEGNRKLQLLYNCQTQWRFSQLFVFSLRKWKSQLIVPIYLGTKTSKFCFKIISLWSLESQLSLDLEDSELNFNRAHLTTVNSLLRAMRAICNISSDGGEDFLRKSCFYIRNGKLDTKQGSR